MAWTELADFTQWASAKTKAQLLTETRSRLNELLENFYLDSEINQWLDLGAIDISARTLCLDTYATESTSGTSGEFTLPTNLIKIFRLIYSDGSNWKRLAFIDYRDYDTDYLWSSTTDTANPPDAFFIYQRKLVIVPTPSYAGTNNIKLYYWKYQTPVADSANKYLIPPEYQDMVIDFAVYQAFRKSKLWNDANTVYLDYLKKTDRALIELHQKTRESYGVIKDISESYTLNGMRVL